MIIYEIVLNIIALQINLILFFFFFLKCEIIKTLFHRIISVFQQKRFKKQLMKIHNNTPQKTVHYCYAKTNSASSV